MNDDAASLLALCGLLREREGAPGYGIFPVNSGQAALREVLKHDFAVIFLDVNMPGMDGYETAEAIRSRPRSAGTPIIFVTAFLADELDRARAYASGAVDFLFSPVIPQILRAKADVFVKLFSQNAQLRRQSHTLELRESALVEANIQLQAEITERLSAERQNDARDEFLAMLGHELRNPLSAITSAATLSGMPTTDAATLSKAKAIIERQSQHMMSMVDEVLDLSRASTGKLQLTPVTVDLCAVVAQCVDKFRSQTSHLLHSSLVAATIEADPLRVAQMVSQLIENAIKYSPPHSSIHIDVVNDGERASISVQDHGEGIAEEKLPHVFEVFVQAGVTIDRRRGGLGIGLAMVKQLCRLHGGQVNVRSGGIGCGSTFVLDFPLSPRALTGPVHQDASGQKMSTRD
ncbi:MAG: hybrid sensor histidine kinase/response regulator [Pseudomonadota bacterium]